MKFRSVDCQRRSEEVDLWDPAVPEGTFFWDTQQIGAETILIIWIKMPYEVTRSGHPWHCLRVRRKGDPERVPPEPWWEWDGDEDRPTLTPSIGCGPSEERDWHGYMTRGRLEACE